MGDWFNRFDTGRDIDRLGISRVWGVREMLIWAFFCAILFGGAGWGVASLLHINQEASQFSGIIVAAILFAVMFLVPPARHWVRVLCHACVSCTIWVGFAYLINYIYPFSGILPIAMMIAFGISGFAVGWNIALKYKW